MTRKEIFGKKHNPIRPNDKLYNDIWMLGLTLLATITSIPINKLYIMAFLSESERFERIEEVEE